MTPEGSVHEATDPRFELLLDLDSPVRTLGTDYGFAEGPIWHPIGHYLLCSDIPGDVWRWDGSGAV